MCLSTIVSGILLNVVSNRLDAFITDKLPKGHKRKLWLASFKNTDIRISIAYLYRIELNGEYLLVKGNRINQYQPVGGVRKFYPEAQAKLREWGVRNDNCLELDETSKNDLRLRVPSQNLLKFLDWYESRKEREVNQRREFLEELITPNHLPKDLFHDFDVEYLYTVPTLHYSLHFQCWELLYHEIYEPKFSTEQEDAVKRLKKLPSEDYKWVTEELILALGHDKRLGRKPFPIGEHARILISKDHKLFNP